MWSLRSPPTEVAPGAVSSTDCISVEFWAHYLAALILNCSNRKIKLTIQTLEDCSDAQMKWRM